MCLHETNKLAARPSAHPFSLARDKGLFFSRGNLAPRQKQIKPCRLRLRRAGVPHPRVNDKNTTGGVVVNVAGNHHSNDACMKPLVAPFSPSPVQHLFSCVCSIGSSRFVSKIEPRQRHLGLDSFFHKFTAAPVLRAAAPVPSQQPHYMHVILLTPTDPR